MKELIFDLQQRLDKVDDRKTRDWWEKYLRNTIDFRGVNLVKIRDELHKWHKRNRVENLTTTSQLTLALAFFQGKYAEDKLAGVLFLQEFLYKKIQWKIIVPKLAQLFEKGYIYDWNVCDWFSVRVLGPMIKENGMPCAKAIAQWRASENVWQARAAVVAFVNLTKVREFTPLILRSCAILIKREERFAETAVGWILRELSKSDKNIVIGFIEKSQKWFTKESMDNAIKKLTSSEKQRLRSAVIPIFR